MSDELDLYWEYEGTGILLTRQKKPCRDAFSIETDTLLKDFSCRHPATRYAILHLAIKLGYTAVLRCATGMCREERDSRHQ
jgi:hypothetical protein